MLKRHNHITMVFADTLFYLPSENIDIVVMKVQIRKHIVRQVFSKGIVQHFFIGLKSIQEKEYPPYFPGYKITFVGHRINNTLRSEEHTSELQSRPHLV